VAVEFGPLPVEPCDDALGIPYVSEQSNQPNCEDQLVRRGPTLFPEALQVASRDTRKSRLVRLRDSRKRLLQVGNQGPSVIIAAPRVLIEGIPHDMADRLRIHEESVERVERSSLVRLLQCSQEVDDDLPDLSYCLWLELWRKIIAELHGQTTRRVDPQLRVLGINCILRGRTGRLDCIAKLRKALANSSLQVGEFLLLRVPIKN